MRTFVQPMKWSLAKILAAALPTMAQLANTWNGGGADDNWITAGN